MIFFENSESLQVSIIFQHHKKNILNCTDYPLNLTDLKIGGIFTLLVSWISCHSKSRGTLYISQHLPYVNFITTCFQIIFEWSEASAGRSRYSWSSPITISLGDSSTRTVSWANPIPCCKIFLSTGSPSSSLRRLKSTMKCFSWPL